MQPISVTPSKLKIKSGLQVDDLKWKMSKKYLKKKQKKLKPYLNKTKKEKQKKRCTIPS